jgi:hypothetical protein
MTTGQVKIWLTPRGKRPHRGQSVPATPKNLSAPQKGHAASANWLEIAQEIVKDRFFFDANTQFGKRLG